MQIFLLALTSALEVIWIFFQGAVIGYALIFPFSFLWGYEYCIRFLLIGPIVWLILSFFLPKKLCNWIFISTALFLVGWWLWWIISLRLGLIVH